MKTKINLATIIGVSMIALTAFVKGPEKKISNKSPRVLVITKSMSIAQTGDTVYVGKSSDEDTMYVYGYYSPKSGKVDPDYLWVIKKK